MKDYKEVHQLLDDVANELYKEHHSYAYATGLFQGFLIDLIMGYASPDEVINRVHSVLVKYKQPE